MKYIFIDSNIFLHCQFFDQIDWLNVCSSDTCKLIISPVIIDELDKNKLGNSKIGKRARNTLLIIEEYFENNVSEIREKVFFEVINNKPSKSIYDEYELNFEEQDHKFLASIIEYKNQHPNIEIYLCSNNIGPRLRAKQFQIGILKLPSKYLLPAKDTDKDKKIRKLEEENLLLKTKIPKTKLEFENGNDFIKIKIDTSEHEKDEFIEVELSKLKKEYSYLESQEQNNDDNSIPSIFKGLNSFSLSDNQINDYNSKLEEFFKKYEEFLYNQYGYERKNQLAIRIKIFLVNTGTTPAEEIDIHLHFPNGFELMQIEDFQRPPKKPEAPYKPKSRFDFSNLGITAFMPNFTSNLSDLNINKPSIKKTNSYDVDFYRKHLKHHYKNQLDELVAIYRNFNDMINFSIDYEISVANMPESIVGKLSIIYEK